MKKRILIFVLLACVLLSFSGCADESATSTSGSIDVASEASSVSDSSATSFDDPSVTAQEPDDPALYFTDYVYNAFQDFSVSSGFSVSEVHTSTIAEYDIDMNSFEVSFPDTGNSFFLSVESGSKSYVILCDLPESDEINSVLAATIYAAYPALSSDQAMAEADDLSSTLSESPGQLGLSTETRPYGNCEIKMTFDSERQEYTIFSDYIFT